jgi:hypothetical protein
LAALACTAALVASGVAPATAADWIHEDAVGDVQTLTYDETTEEEPDFVVDPDNANTDITRVMVRHRAHRVALRMTLRDIRRGSGAAVFDIRTDGRDFFAIKSLGRNALDFAPGWLLANTNGRPVRCPEARHYVKRTTEEAVVRIPRRCLGFPEWVRVGAGAQTLKETRMSFSVAIDDGLREGEFQDTLALSPRVFRGEPAVPTQAPVTR